MDVFVRQDGYPPFHLVTCDPDDDAQAAAYKEDLEIQQARFMFRNRTHAMAFAELERVRAPETLPKRLQFEEGDSLPDYVHGFPGSSTQFSSACLMSQRLMELVDGFKGPDDAWAFHPVEILHIDGSPFETRYIWCVDRVLDSIDPTSEGVGTVGVGPLDGTHAWQTRGELSPARQRVLKDVIGDIHAWSDFRYRQWLGVFVSDRLLEAMASSGMTGFKAETVWSEV